MSRSRADHLGRRRRASLVAVAFALIAGLSGASASAHDDPSGSAMCTIRAISAMKDGAGVDPAIGDLAPKLTRPPFTEWKSFKQLARHEAKLTTGNATSFQLPDGRTTTLKYMQHVMDGARHRVRLHLELKRGGASQLSTQFVLDEGGTVLHVGAREGGGLTILAVGCSTGA